MAFPVTHVAEVMNATSKLALKFFGVLLCSAFLLNWAWELAQTKAYAPHGTSAEAMWGCTRATFADAAITLGLYAIAHSPRSVSIGDCAAAGMFISRAPCSVSSTPCSWKSKRPHPVAGAIRRTCPSFLFSTLDSGPYCN